MKKLMIAAAIVCAAAFAQAGTVKWSSGYLNVYGQEGDMADFVDGSTVYLMNAGSTTRDAFLLAISNAGDDYASAFATQVGSAFGSATLSANELTEPSVGEATDGLVKIDTEAASLALYMVALDTDNKAVYVSELLGPTAIDPVGGTDFTFDHDGAFAGNVFAAKDGAQTAGGWYTAAAVPEPTSGLLLLLGVAGLALRRRRA